METPIGRWEIKPHIAFGEDGLFIQSFTNRIIHRPDGSWRIWYTLFSRTVGDKRCIFGYRDFSHDFKVRKDTRMKIADRPEKDGLNIIGVPHHWRLVQPVHLDLPDGRERLYFWAHGSEGICRFLVADSTDGSNFVVDDWRRPTLYHPNDRAISRQALKHKALTAYCHAGHKDLDPNEPEASEDMLMNDATNVYVLPDGTFELYSADVVELPADAPEPRQKDDVIRFIQRRTSADGICWSPPRRILFRDEKDPYDLQFYYLSVTHAPEKLVGILGHYRSDPGTMDMEFCSSLDGISWSRQRVPGFPRLKAVESVYAPHSMIRVEDQYYLFYTGYNQNHHRVTSPDAYPGMPHSWIGLAVIPVRYLLQCV